MNKLVRCVICNNGGPQIFIPSNDETKTELNALLGVYYHYVKVTIRGPSASYLNDFTYRDSSVFYSFCDVCQPHIDRLYFLSCQTQNQIERILNVPLVEPNVQRQNDNYNVSVPRLNRNEQKATSSASNSGAHRSGRTGTEAKRLKMTHDERTHQTKNNSLSSSDTGYSDISSSSCEIFETDEAEVSVVVEENSSVQNKNVPMVSIDCDDNEGENNYPEIIVKPTGSSNYFFTYKNDPAIGFMRSICFLKFDCSSCSTQTKNITEMITHIWTCHCDDGKVKTLPNYRIDAANSSSTTQRSGAQANGIEDIGAETRRSDGVMREVIRVDQSRVLTYLSCGRVYYERDLLFHDVGNGRFSCSYCFSMVPRHEIFTHTACCLPTKLRQTGTSIVRHRGTRWSSPVQPDSYFTQSVQNKNGWPYYKINDRRHKCGVSSCMFEDKTEIELFTHLRRRHAGVFDSTVACSVCSTPPFRNAESLWDHLYQKHRRNYF